MGKLDLWRFRFQGPLSKEQNTELLAEYKQTQDKEKKLKIRDQIVYGNMPLAISFFNKHYYYDDLTKEDLLQEATLAIARSIEDFDLDEEVAFSTYLRKSFLNILIRQLKTDYGTRNVLSLSQELLQKNGEKDGSIIEDIVEEQYFDEAWVLHKTEVDHILHVILPKFNKFEQEIFRDIFLKGKTHVEVAKKYDITRQYVSRIVTKMLGDIRKVYEGKSKEVHRCNSNSLFSERKPDSKPLQAPQKSQRSVAKGGKSK